MYEQCRLLGELVPNLRIDALEDKDEKKDSGVHLLPLLVFRTLLRILGKKFFIPKLVCCGIAGSPPNGCFTLSLFPRAPRGGLRAGPHPQHPGDGALPAHEGRGGRHGHLRRGGHLPQVGCRAARPGQSKARNCATAPTLRVAGAGSTVSRCGASDRSRKHR